MKKKTRKPYYRDDAFLLKIGSRVRELRLERSLTQMDLAFKCNDKDYSQINSMDGKGRAIDNIFIERLWRTVKYEYVYLHAVEDGVQLYDGLNKYFTFYNHQRPHQSLEYKTPGSCYLKMKAA